MTTTELRRAKPANWRELGDQRLEIVRLQKRLALAEKAAARCAIMLREGDHRIKVVCPTKADAFYEPLRLARFAC